MAFVLFYAIFTNLPFWAASHWLGLLPLGWFCLEYAGVGLLALFIPRILAAALLLLTIAADLTSAVSKTYYLSPTDCLANSPSLMELPPARLVRMAAVALLTLLVAAIAARFPVARIRGNRLRAAACLLGFAALAVAVDFTSVARETGHLPNPLRLQRPVDQDKFSDFTNLWISRYPMLRLAREQTMFGRIQNPAAATLAGALPLASAADIAVRAAGIDSAHPPPEEPNLVLVLLESWGLDSDPAIRDSLVRPYAQPGLLARYQVLQGTVPFFGSTLGGEARELCGSKIGMQIVNVSTQGLATCLPRRLAALGYRSLALHGMGGHMFSRSTWYTTIGFQEQWFGDRFRRQGLPDCGGAFVGTCDAAIAEWIGRRLQVQSENPQFAYWVTLGSHLPAPIPSGLPAAASCSLTPLLSQQPALCSWYQLVSNVHDAVARLAMANLARPTVFVLVGDHAPPFANPAVRSHFSATDVPYLLLVPRRDPRQDPPRSPTPATAASRSLKAGR